MQIVISVTDLQRKWIENYGFIADDLNVKMAEAILNGTVLPKHGRLIDADRLIKQTAEQICEKCDRRRGMKDGKLTKRFGYEIGDAPCRARGIGDMHDYLDDAPTILEATGVAE